MVREVARLRFQKMSGKKRLISLNVFDGSFIDGISWKFALKGLKFLRNRILQHHFSEIYGPISRQEI